VRGFAEHKRRVGEVSINDTRVAESIRRGLEEAIAYVEGTADRGLYNVQRNGRFRGS